jgi:hypothetical protein
MDAEGVWVVTEDISYSAVVANPSDAATAKLEKLKVNDTTYANWTENEIKALARQEELKNKVDKSQLSVEPSANKVSQFDEYGNQKTGAPRADNDCVRQVDLKNALQNADNFYAALLNDTNTTSIFKAWYNAVSKDEGDRFTLLERFFKMCALNNNQIHTVRFVSPSVSSESRGTPLDWLADKKAQNLSTDAGVFANANKWIDAEGTGRTDGEDWATENRLTWYIRANALSLENGKMNVTAIEGIDAAFDITGETAPVYTFQLSPYFKETDDGNKYIAYTADEVSFYYDGKITAEDVRADFAAYWYFAEHGETKEERYNRLVAAFVREKYSQNAVEAIINNYLADPNNTEYVAEFTALQNFRKECKAKAKGDL